VGGETKPYGIFSGILLALRRLVDFNGESSMGSPFFSLVEYPKMSLTVVHCCHRPSQNL
jgi:hypothetical protein